MYTYKLILIPAYDEILIDGIEAVDKKEIDINNYEEVADEETSTLLLHKLVELINKDLVDTENNYILAIKVTDKGTILKD